MNENKHHGINIYPSVFKKNKTKKELTIFFVVLKQRIGW